jgi:uroporphyrinogen-III synthase
MSAREERTARLDQHVVGDGAAERAARFGHLPERIPPEHMIEEVAADAPHDPDFGRDPDADWMVKYSA